MSSTPTRFSGPQQLSNAAATIYTTPAASIAEVTCIHVSNPSGSTVGLTMSIGADAAGVRIYDDFPIGANTAQDLFCEHPLVAGEIIQAFADTAGVLVVELSGNLRVP